MRHLIGSIIAITLAGVAAIAATTALLNAPVRSSRVAAQTALAAEEPKPASDEIPDAPPPKGANAPEQPAPTSAGSATGEAAGDKPAAEGANGEESDADPYEGIAPEELPPDLQYDADASVSFPTNT